MAKHCETCTCMPTGLGFCKIRLDGKDVIVRQDGRDMRISLTGIKGNGVPIWHRTARGYEQRLPDGQPVVVVTVE